MKKLLLLVLLLVLASSVSAQDNLFTLVGDLDHPVVPHGKAGAWDAQYTDPGAVFYADGKFNMFRNGFNGWPVPVQIGYATSDDGVHWTEVGSDPVLLSKDVPYAKVAALASDGMVMDDGTWVLYFYTWNSFSSTTASGAIGRATAPAPTGPWTPDPAPILNPGSAGGWDELRVSAPRIVKSEDGSYRMYYTGYDKTGIGSGKIGLATSPDGITWTKYNDSATTDAAFGESDPIMVPLAHFDFNQPMVEQTPDGWVMTFRQVDTTKRPGMSLNYALSDDGIHWNVASDKPFWDATSLPGQFYYTAMEYHDGTYYQYIEGAKLSNTQIYVATHSGSLKPTN